MTRVGALAVLLIALLLGGCAASEQNLADETGLDLANPNSTRETYALYANLQRLAPDHVMFGHHDALAYGTTWRDQPGDGVVRSDVGDVTGSHPAVFGWDVFRLHESRRIDVPDPERAAQLRQWMLEAYEGGGVSTLAWHMPNPVAQTHSWDTTRAVYALLPGGELHETYTASLDILADFLHNLKPEGAEEPIPVIFRPFHEHTGSWFWWGERHATVDEYVGLWRFTVDYLRDEKDVRNVLYAYSTDVFDSKEQYLERYPGDDYIDILGYDDYHSIATVASRDTLVNRLRMLGEMAHERGKVAALTETGVETVPDATWWTEVLLPALKADPMGQRIAYALVWRNANPDGDREDHYYAPYPGHPSADDFVRFYEDPFVLLQDELPDMYELP